MEKLLDFLEELDEKKIYYRLNKIRPDFIMVEVVVPGQIWEVEFSNERIDIEKFKSTGEIYDESEIKVLFDEFSD